MNRWILGQKNLFCSSTGVSFVPPPLLVLCSPSSCVLNRPGLGARLFSGSNSTYSACNAWANCLAFLSFPSCKMRITRFHAKFDTGLFKDIKWEEHLVQQMYVLFCWCLRIVVSLAISTVGRWQLLERNPLWSFLSQIIKQLLLLMPVQVAAQWNPCTAGYQSCYWGWPFPGSALCPQPPRPIHITVYHSLFSSCGRRLKSHSYLHRSGHQIAAFDLALWLLWLAYPKGILELTKLQMQLIQVS